MNEELLEIINSYLWLGDRRITHRISFSIFEPDSFGIVVFKTEIEILELNRDIENWLNRKSISFGLEGPYKVKWEKLEE